MAVSSTPGLAKPCLMFFPSLCTRFIGIRYATYPEGKRCANLDAVLGRGVSLAGGIATSMSGLPALAHERRGGASCRSSDARNAPLATVGLKKAPCRDGPKNEIARAIGVLDV